MCFPILKPNEKKMYEISFELIFKIHTFNIEVLKKVDRGEYLLIYLINKIAGSFCEDLICNWYSIQYCLLKETFSTAKYDWGKWKKVLASFFHIFVKFVTLKKEIYSMAGTSNLWTNS